MPESETCMWSEYRFRADMLVQSTRGRLITTGTPL